MSGSAWNERWKRRVKNSSGGRSIDRDLDVEDDEAAHVLGMGAGVGVGRGATEVVADEKDLLEAEAAHELVDVFGDGALVVTVDRLAGFAEAPQIGGDDRVVSRELGDDLAPHVPGLRKAVEQYDGIALTGAHIMNADAVGESGVVLELDRHGAHSFAGSRSMLARGPGPRHHRRAPVSRARSPASARTRPMRSSISSRVAATTVTCPSLRPARGSLP